MPEILKVTDPLKMVTDPVLFTTLGKQGIDPEYVEFFQDYASRSLGKEHSPYAKFYRDLKSSKRFMVVSGLPMVDANGVMVEVGWIKSGSSYISKVNQFEAIVAGTKVTLTVKNDQPDGRKAGEKVTYQPQLYLNGAKQTCGKSSLLPIDPLNPNYLENTLEWDYGICKRRLRIIEGSILGSWVFPSKPSGEVRIKYNQTGDYKLRLGQFRINDDEEVIKPEDFDKLAIPFGYPATISDSATFYPDAHPNELTSVDGTVVDVEVTTGVDWATLIGAVGTQATDSATDMYMFFRSGLSSNKWDIMQRMVTLFDVTTLPSGALISAVTESLYGEIKSDAQNRAPDISIYSSAPASNTALAAGDFDSLGTTPFSSIITYANWKTANPFWNDFVFNAAGIAFVQAAADGDNIVKLAARDATHDAGGNVPTWGAKGIASYFGAYTAEQGNGYKPKLVVTYTAGWANIKNIRAGTGTITATDLDSIWFGTGQVAVADIAEIPVGVAV